MRVVFAGTPAMVVPCLEALHQADGVDIVGVVSRADTKAKRGMKMQASAVKAYALQHHFDVITPLSLQQDAESLAWLKQKQADVLVVVAYGMLLPKSWLEAARFGSVNLHASLLPRWRGAAPIERALLAGDAQTGVCIMAMDEGLDTGAIYNRCTVAIAHDSTCESLRKDLMEKGNQLLVQTLLSMNSHPLKAIKQAESGVSYAHKIQNSERIVDWQQSALQVDRQVRTFSPKPGVRTKFQGKWLKIIQGEVCDVQDELACGHIQLDKTTFEVGCAQGCYRITQVQPEGKRVMPMQDFIRGLQVRTGLKMDDV